MTLLNRIATLFVALWLTAFPTDGPNDALLTAPVVESLQGLADGALRRLDRDAPKGGASAPDNADLLAGVDALHQPGQPLLVVAFRRTDHGLREHHHELAQARAPPAAMN
jgi:hypothetical protein